VTFFFDIFRRKVHEIFSSTLLLDIDQGTVPLCEGSFYLRFRPIQHIHSTVHCKILQKRNWRAENRKCFWHKK